MSKLLSAYKTRFGAKGHAVSVNTGTSEVFKVLRILLLSNLIECRQSRYSQSLNLRRVLNFNDNSDCVATKSVVKTMSAYPPPAPTLDL